MESSKVRHIDKDQYDPSGSKYMQAYSFVSSWGWRREKIDEVWHWISGDDKYKTQDIHEAAAVQRSRIREDS